MKFTFQKLLVTSVVMSMFGLPALANPCQEKLDNALDQLTTHSSIRVVNNLVIDGKAIWQDIAEYVPTGISRHTHKLLVPVTDPAWQKTVPLEAPISPDDVMIFAGHQSYDNGKARYAPPTPEDLASKEGKALLEVRHLFPKEQFTATTCDNGTIGLFYDRYAPAKDGSLLDFLREEGEFEKLKAERLETVNSPDFVSDINTGAAKLDENGRISSLTISDDSASFPRPGVSRESVVTYDDTISIEVPN